MRDVAPQRRIIFIPSEDIAQVADAGGGKRLDRSRRDGVDADVLDAEIGGEIATEASSAALATPMTL